MKKLVLASVAGTLALLAFSPVFSQEAIGSPVNVIDGVYVPTHNPTTKCVPYESLRQADVIWSKRVWSYIDLRERINQPLYYPLDEISPMGIWTVNSSRLSLWTILRKHIINGDITLFSPYNPLLMGYGGLDGDQLKYPVRPKPGYTYKTDSVFKTNIDYYFADIHDNLSPCLIEDINDPLFGEIKTRITETGDTVMVYNPADTTWITSKDIIQYRIKEDYFFDKERSVMDSRIIALAPVRYTTELVNGELQVTGMEELFWVYFPECRRIFDQYVLFNSKNDDSSLSYDDLFLKRMYSAVVYKESNVMDRSIDSYAFGVDALQESERVKSEIRAVEHDIWSY